MSKSSRWSEYRYRRRVQFYELDSAGIVHFSTYFRYMEEAEHALWRAAGLSIAPPAATFGFPRVAAAFEYHRPLRFEDEIEVHLRIASIGESSLRYTCAIRCGDELAATGSVTTVCVRTDGPMRAMPLPAHIRARFAVAASEAPSGAPA